MRLALDSDRYTDIARGDPTSIATVESAEQTFIPVIVLGELRAGFLGGSRSSENEETLQRFLRKPPVQVLSADEMTTFHYAAIVQQLRRQGTPIPANDAWIAALAVQHGLTLFTRDAHYDRLPQLMRV